MNNQDKKKLTNHIERNQLMTEISMFGRTAEVDVVPSDRLLDLIDELASPVEVPQFVADWYEMNNKNLEYRIWKYIKNWDDQSWNDFKNWMDKNSVKSLEILTKMQYGYEVEKEPKWIVRVGEKLLFKEYDDNEFPVFVIDDKPGSIQLAENFELEKKAHNVQKEVGGTIEKV